MNIPKLQAHLQSILDANKPPRHGFEETVILHEMEQFNQKCIDYMKTMDLTPIKEQKND